MLTQCLRAAVLTTAVSATSLFAAPLFSENFDVDTTANWNFNSSVTGDTATDDTNSEANFFFDYSTVGIPVAPHTVGTSRVGLKMEANVTGSTPAVVGGATVSPKTQTFTGDYTLSFDCWQNFQGPMPGGGNGTTVIALGGLGTPENTTQAPGASAGLTAVGFAATADGGSSVDYRAYNGSSTTIPGTTVGTYAAGNVAGSTNNSDPYYTGKFQGAVPAEQTTIAAAYTPTFSQTGSPAAGALGEAWHYWEITKSGNTFTWSVDGFLIATTTSTSQPGFDFFLGMSDTNTAPSNQAISRQLLFTLFDNVQVNAIPEPTSLALAGVAAAGLLRRRRSM